MASAESSCSDDHQMVYEVVAHGCFYGDFFSKEELALKLKENLSPNSSFRIVNYSHDQCYLLSLIQCDSEVTFKELLNLSGKITVL